MKLISCIVFTVCLPYIGCAVLADSDAQRKHADQYRSLITSLYYQCNDRSACDCWCLPSESAGHSAKYVSCKSSPSTDALDHFLSARRRSDRWCLNPDFRDPNLPPGISSWENYNPFTYGMNNITDELEKIAEELITKLEHAPGEVLDFAKDIVNYTRYTLHGIADDVIEVGGKAVETTFDSIWRGFHVDKVLLFVALFCSVALVAYVTTKYCLARFSNSYSAGKKQHSSGTFNGAEEKVPLPPPPPPVENKYTFTNTKNEPLIFPVSPSVSNIGPRLGKRAWETSNEIIHNNNPNAADI